MTLFFSVFSFFVFCAHALNRSFEFAAWGYQGQFFWTFGNWSYLERVFPFNELGGHGLMRIDRGMQRLIRAAEKDSLLGWKKSFSRGIGVTTPKARARDKPLSMVLAL